MNKVGDVMEKIIVGGGLEAQREQLELQFFKMVGAGVLIKTGEMLSDEQKKQILEAEKSSEDINELLTKFGVGEEKREEIKLQVINEVLRTITETLGDKLSNKEEVLAMLK